MSYVDGFVLPIPKKNYAAYKKVATKCAKIWLEHGALSYVECVGDDTPVGKLTSFPRAVKLKKDETVWFSWIVYANRKERDRINKKVMNDPRILAMGPQSMPFDGKRMVYGGFRSVIQK